MRLPNLLASRRGRLLAFFLLYTTEGVPLGFAATAVATQLRRYGVGPAEIGAFVASFYLPWAFKWAFGPFVDVFRSQRFGHRRGWILLTQAAMVLTLLAVVPVPLPQGLWLFTAILLVHNTFAAVQDVAIDSLAVATLHPDERGLANGLMFAGAAVGQGIGGSGVLFLLGWIGLQSSIVLVALSILAITVFVVLPMKETLVEALGGQRLAGWHAAGAEMKRFAVQSFRSFMGTRGAFYGVLFALLPAGAMSLGLSLQSNLAVEVGMGDDAVALLNLWCSGVAAAGMVLGGMLSDKLGRRRTLFFYIAGMSLPVLWLMWVLRQHGYEMPRAPGGPALPALVTALWIASIAYNVFQGLMYGTRSAIFMDVTNPAVAATQFTAYMALMNLATAMAATWQGIAAEAWGYPVTLAIDAVAGLLCLALLPLLRPEPGSFSDGRAERRARASALVLGLLCLAWLLYWANRELFGKGQPIMGTLFTVVFVASGLYLLAAREVLGEAAGLWRRAALWVGLLLLAMHGRHYLDGIAGLPVLHMAAGALVQLVPLAGGVVLLAMSRRRWEAVLDMHATHNR